MPGDITAILPQNSPAMKSSVVVKTLGTTAYHDCLAQMQAYTDARTPTSADEIWLTSHASIYTLGQSGKLEHLLRASSIPIVYTDRGGQITYHGPGQIVAYLLIDLYRAGLGIRTLVRNIEAATIDLLATLGIVGERCAGRPGVYVNSAKIAAIGLRVKRGCSYHGMSLNVDCDLTPFADINTCGYADLRDTSLRQLGVDLSCATIAPRLGAGLAKSLQS